MLKKFNIEIKIATNFLARLIGLMGKKNISYGLIIPKCNSIHTFFMKEAIHVLLLDNNYNIIEIKKNVKPFKIITFKYKKNNSNILELPFNYKI